LDIRKVNNRDRKREKRRSGEIVDGKGIFILERRKWERAQEIKKKLEQKRKELILNGDADPKS
jgi:hypothetical protein